jgi:hypothetical protein
MDQIKRKILKVVRGQPRPLAPCRRSKITLPKPDNFIRYRHRMAAFSPDAGAGMKPKSRDMYSHHNATAQVISAAARNTGLTP